MDANNGSGSTNPKSNKENVMMQSNASSSPQSAVPTDSANNSTSKASRRLPKNSLKNQQDRFANSKKRWANVSDPALASDQAAVDVAFSKAEQAGAQLADAAAASETAKKAWAAQEPKLVPVLKRLVALLKLTDAGMALYKACWSYRPMVTATNLLGRLPPSQLGLPGAVASEFRTTVTALTPAWEALTAAEKAEATAQTGFEAARTGVDNAISAMNATGVRRLALSRPPRKKAKKKAKKAASDSPGSAKTADGSAGAVEQAPSGTSVGTPAASPANGANGVMQPAHV